VADVKRRKQVLCSFKEDSTITFGAAPAGACAVDHDIKVAVRKAAEIGCADVDRIDWEWFGLQTFSGFQRSFESAYLAAGRKEVPGQG
jgi:hypothetical protein